MRFLAILAVTVSAALGSAGSAFAEEQKRVLVLYAARRDAQVAIVGDRELPRLLGRGLPAGLDYYSEYLDLVRSEDPTYQAGFRDYLLVKYSGIRFDVVIAMQETALDFVEANRDKLFPETPIVFVSMTDRRPAVANETGTSRRSPSGRHARLRRRPAARPQAGVCRHRRVKYRQDLREAGARATQALPIPVCRDLPGRAADARARGTRSRHYRCIRWCFP